MSCGTSSCRSMFFSNSVPGGTYLMSLVHQLNALALRLTLAFTAVIASVYVKHGIQIVMLKELSQEWGHLELLTMQETFYPELTTVVVDPIC